jgi:hypothetical protein
MAPPRTVQIRNVPDDVYRRLKSRAASRARGGTLPQTKSFIRPECAREVDGGRTRRPGLLEPLVYG